MAENSLKPSENAVEDSSAISVLEGEIIRQIEHYFGDYHLSKHKFLRMKLKEDEGWIPLSILLTFNRLKILTANSDVVINALKKSKTNLLEIHEDKSKVRRNPAAFLLENMEKRQKEVMLRSVYVKGFPLTVTLGQLLAFFKAQGVVVTVQMRKNYDKTFKGSVFAIFDTKEVAEKFTKDDSIKFENSELVREMRSDYHARKCSMRTKKKEETLLKKADHEKKTLENKELKFERGRVLRITGLAESTYRENLKKCFEPHATVDSWIDFNTGDTDAWVRFEEPKAELALNKAAEAAGGKLKINGTEVFAKVVEGEEEDEYWERTYKAKEEGRKKRENRMRGRRRGRGRGRAGRGRGRGGRGRGRAGPGRGRAGPGRGRAGPGRGRAGRGRGRGGKLKEQRRRDNFDGDEPPAKQLKVEIKQEMED